MRCSASSMFASDNVNSSWCIIRRSIYSLMTRIDTSLNPIFVGGGGAMCIEFVCRHFVTYAPHCYIIICSFYLTLQHHAFVLILYGHIVHVLLSEINDDYYYY